MKISTSSGSKSSFKITHVSMQPRCWTAYGVRDARGGLSFETYDTPEKAKKDKLWKVGSKIVKLRISEVSEIETCELSFAQQMYIDMGVCEINEHGEYVRVQKEASDAET